jgi:hypothetical protein
MAEAWEFGLVTEAEFGCIVDPEKMVSPYVAQAS